MVKKFPNAYIISDEMYYNDRQREAFKIIFEIAREQKSDVVYYNIRQHPDALSVDDFTNIPSFNLYVEYTDITFDEIDDQILSIYRNYKSSTEESIDDYDLRPFIMVVDGVSKIKDPEEFRIYLEQELSLLEFLNIYVIAII